MFLKIIGLQLILLTVTAIALINSSVPCACQRKVMFDIKLASFNICKLFSASKSKILESYLKDLTIHIAACQEIAFHNINLYDYNYIKNFDVKSGTGCSFLIRKDIEFSDHYKSPDGRIYAIKTNGIIIVNVYFPSGKDNEKCRNFLFTNQLAVYLNGINSYPFVLCGDFNSSFEKVFRQQTITKMKILKLW